MCVRYERTLAGSMEVCCNVLIFTVPEHDLQKQANDMKTLEREREIKSNR